MKKTTSKVLLLILLSLPPQLQAEAIEPLSLSQALSMAVEDNPGLAEMKARSEAMAQIPSQVGSLPDPVISFNALNLPVDTFDTAQENMTQMQGGISQAIPFPGKLALREQAANFEAEAAAFDVVEVRWRLLRDVKKLWWALVYLDKALNIIRINQDLLRQFVEIAQTKYEVGEGLQQDVLLAQLELSKLFDNELVLIGARENTQAQLNALLNQAANTPIKIPGKINDKLPTLQAESRLYQQAESYRALLASRRKQIDAAQRRVELAKKDYYPDFKIGAYYGGRDNTLSGQSRADFMSMRLSMTVPLYFSTKQDKALSQRRQELIQRKYALQDEWNQVREDISRAVSDFRRSKNQTVLFNSGIIPQARQTVASMLSGYQVDKVDFLNLVRSQITLYNYEIQYWKVLTEANQALAQLTAMIGKEDIYE